jgi:outer membrane protein TolC
MRFVLPRLALLVTLFTLVALGFADVGSAQLVTPGPAIQNIFQRGVPSGTATTESITLNVVDAINRALEHNLGLLAAEELAGRAKGARWIALADLLPNVSGRLSETRQKVNLAAFGFPLPPSLGFPEVVGPFNVFDARIYVSQAVLDFRALNASRAESHNLAAANYSVKSARDLVVLAAANAYLESLAASARADSARAQTESAQAIFDQASHMRESGIVAGIDVLRAEVQLGLRRQRATAAQNDFDKSKLQLARIIGLPIGQAFTLSDDVPFVPVPEMTLEEALDRAYKTRPDFLAAQERVRAAEADRQSIVGEMLPAVHVNADFGDIGLSVDSARGTFSLSGAVTVPIFQGGRSQGRLMQADAALKNRRSEAEDLRAGVYYEVRGAFLDLQSTAEQLQVATRGRDLAQQQLTQARDRFAAGVTNNVEVVQAQEAVAEASEQYISALYGYNVAKAMLARSLGVAEDAARQYLGGVR